MCFSQGLIDLFNNTTPPPKPLLHLLSKQPPIPALRMLTFSFFNEHQYHFLSLPLMLLGFKKNGVESMLQGVPINMGIQ